MKHLVSVAAAVAAATLSTAQVQEGTPSVTVNGHPVVFPDMQPRFMYNHVMVPIRGVFERLHADVEWDSGLRQVTCVKDDSTVQLYLGDREAKVNGERVHFDAPATMSHGRTMVPLRFLSQALGAHVEWDDATQTVKIETPKHERERARER